PLFLRNELRKSARKLQGASFFLQGQMDIHPKAYWPSVLAGTTGGFFPPGDAHSAAAHDTGAEGAGRVRGTGGVPRTDRPADPSLRARAHAAPVRHVRGIHGPQLRGGVERA